MFLNDIIIRKREYLCLNKANLYSLTTAFVITFMHLTKIIQGSISDAITELTVMQDVKKNVILKT